MSKAELKTARENAIKKICELTILRHECKEKREIAKQELNEAIFQYRLLMDQTGE